MVIIPDNNGIVFEKCYFCRNSKKSIGMSEKEMNSYRFVSGQEPSDEMLSQLMSEVAEEAVERRKRADDEYFSQMRRNVAAKKERWAERINQVKNNLL